MEKIVAWTALAGCVFTLAAAAIAYGRGQQQLDTLTTAHAKDVGVLFEKVDAQDARVRQLEQSQASTARALEDIGESLKGIRSDLNTALTHHH